MIEYVENTIILGFSNKDMIFVEDIKASMSEFTRSISLSNGDFAIKVSKYYDKDKNKHVATIISNVDSGKIISSIEIVGYSKDVYYPWKMKNRLISIGDSIVDTIYTEKLNLLDVTNLQSIIFKIVYLEEKNNAKVSI